MDTKDIAISTISIEALLRSMLKRAVEQSTDDPDEQFRLAGGVAALLLRGYVQQAPDPEVYLETVIRHVLAP